MYKAMKTLITKKYYKTAEEVRAKLDVFFAVGRLTDDEYLELVTLTESVYGDE